jgi:hypothetical protein
MDDKLKVINIILDMYPDLKKDRHEIINAVYGNLNKPTRQIFTKIRINNSEVYVDNTGLVLDANLNFKGFIINNIQYLIDDSFEKISIC